MESQQRVIYVGLKVVSDLKLRASYGAVGNTAIDPYKTQGVLSKRCIHGMRQMRPDSAFQKSLIQPWVEKSATVDMGLDFGLFLTED